MAERLIEERWAHASPRIMNERLDVIRRRADYLAMKISRAPTGSYGHEEREHAALMWALAELSGIGEEVRREKADVFLEKQRSAKKEKTRADAAETLNVQYRVKIEALKAELHRAYSARPEDGR